jgi:diguanylate cyclase (GGDEF)-like protein
MVRTLMLPKLAQRARKIDWYQLLKFRTIAGRIVASSSLLLAAALTLLAIVLIQGYRADRQILDVRAGLSLLEQQESLAITSSRFRDLSMSLAGTSEDETRHTLLLAELQSASDALLKSGDVHFRILASPTEMNRWQTLVQEMPIILRYLQQPVAPNEALRASLRENTVRAFNNELVSSISIVRGREIARRHAVARRLQDVILTTRNIVFFLNLIIALAVPFVLLDLYRNLYKPAHALRIAATKISRGKLGFTGIDTKFVELADVNSALLALQETVLHERNASNIDALTGQSNRDALFSFFEAAALSDRASLALIDIDRFKRVNDEFGHAAGDELIKDVCKRLQVILPNGSHVARLGGDELCAYIVLPKSESQQTVAERIVREMRVPFDLGSAIITASVSVGFTDISGRAGTKALNEILHEADLALYVAKNSGRDKAAQYEPSMGLENAVRRSLESELLRAVESDELTLAYQPICSLNDDTQEVEALVRWKHKEHGQVSPMLIIDVAEQSGQMIRLGDWIIEQALNDLSRWPNLRISINLSIRQLQSENFTTRVLELCRNRKIAPARIMFEVTETIALEQNDRALLTLGLLKGLGFKIALDDFGAGYSSLWLLKSFDFDRLKLDRSLISDLASNETSRAVFETAVMLGRRLGLQVVAEGVTDEQEMDLLTRAGCTHLQGYYLSTPLERQNVAAYFEIRQMGLETQAAIARAVA